MGWGKAPSPTSRYMVDRPKEVSIAHLAKAQQFQVNCLNLESPAKRIGPHDRLITRCPRTMLICLPQPLTGGKILHKMQLPAPEARRDPTMWETPAFDASVYRLVGSAFAEVAIGWIRSIIP